MEDHLHFDANSKTCSDADICSTDDLPEIRDNIRKGFLETQKTVNSWISTFKKKIDGEEEDPEFTQGQAPRPAQGYGSGYASPPGGQPYPGRRSADMRRSADLQRYDADMQPIGDDFSKLELRDGEAPPRTSSRPLANPNLFRSGGTQGPERRPSPGTTRKVSFQEGPPEEIKDMYSASPKPAATPQSTGKTSKWQPLKTMDPSPVNDNDPFSLGDSDEEKDAKPITLMDDEIDAKSSTEDKKATVESAKDDEDDQVKKATDEAMKESISADAKK